MAVTAGALSKVSVGRNSASLLSLAATAGTGPYTYQWYRSTTSGFTPAGGNAISGATSLTLNDSGLEAGTAYYYKVVATDTGDGNATSTSSQLTVYTAAALPIQNQFEQSTVLGQVALSVPQGTKAAQIDSSESGTLVAGQAVKVVDSAGGVPKVVACSADSDQVFGFINYDVKSQGFVAGQLCEISQAGNCIWLQATGAIARGAQVTLDTTMVGGVAQLVGSSGDRIVGYAYDKASVGQLIRVVLNVPSFAVA